MMREVGGRSRRMMKRNLMRPMIACALLASALTLEAWAEPLPTIAVDTPYADARKILMDLGYQPAPASDAEACDANSDATCYPERITCAGTGLGQCLFVWRKSEMEIEVVTIGEMPIVSLVRCRVGC